MNKLTREKRAKVLHMLCEGQSINAITRIERVGKNTVLRLLADAGKACAAYHDEHVRNLNSKRVQLDELWSFTHCKQRTVKTAKAPPANAGDTWTWVGLDADSKLIISYLVGGRDAEYAMWFVDDLRARLADRIQLTTDGHRAYLEAVEGAFGADVDFAQLVKVYGPPVAAPGRYSPEPLVGTKMIAVEGRPDPAHISTSYVERQNLTMRMHMRRFTRLTNAFSKKIENHAHAVALHTMYYNFVRIHKTLRVTPAMEAGVSDRLWDIEDIVKLVEANDPQPGPRGPYKKHKG